MEIPVVGVGIALVLGTALYMISTNRQHLDYRVHESRVACDKARNDAEFDRHDKAAQARETVACADFDVQVVARKTGEEENQRRIDQVNAKIDKELNALDQNTASAVAQTAKQIGGK